MCIVLLDVPFWMCDCKKCREPRLDSLGSFFTARLGEVGLFTRNAKDIWSDEDLPDQRR